MADEPVGNQGITRREALKKGALLGGALAWTIPVVQTVGMSAAFAQQPSEGTCCLRIAFAVEKTGANQVTFTGKLKNCGSANIDNARIIYDESRDGGITWNNGIFFQNAGLLFPGQESTRTDDRGLLSGTYQWRARGVYDCLLDPTVEDLPHNIPAAQYVTGGPIVI